MTNLMKPPALIKPEPLRRAVVYARYSTEMQDSIEAQVNFCRTQAARFGLEIVGTYTDEAETSSTMRGRDGLLDLMEASKSPNRAFDAVLVEGMDRISSDQENMAHIYKRLNHRKVDIVSIAQGGKINHMHVALNSTMGQERLELNRRTTRRSLAQKAREGKMTVVPYGYRPIEGKKGEREIVKEKAVVIVRLFTEYAEGRSPRAIAEGLNADGIAAPKAKLWRREAVGELVLNPIYKGQLHWNRTYTDHDPDKNPNAKPADGSDLVITDVPHLRIVSDELWAAADARREARATKLFPNGFVARRPHIPRNEQPLLPLLRCGACGGNMRLGAGPNRLICAAAHARRGCDHSKSYELARLDAFVRERLREQLQDRELIAEHLKAWNEAARRNAKGSGRESADTRKKLADAERRIARLLELAEFSDEAVKTLGPRLKAIEREKAQLAERLRLLEAQNAPTLHPASVANHGKHLDALIAALASSGPDYGKALRMVLDHVAVMPTEKRAPYRVKPYGRLAAIAGAPDLAPASSGAPGYSYTERQTLVFPTVYEQGKGAVCLGEWREAA